MPETTAPHRVAICISGQVRTPREKLKQIAAQAGRIGADVFISVWAERGGKTIESGPRHIAIQRMFGGELSIFLPRGLFFKLEEMCPNWRDILPVRPMVTVEELQDTFPGAVVEVEPDRPELDLPAEKNSLRMLYKIHRCNQLKRAHEEKHGFRYDRVIRVRPDMLVDFQKLATAPLGPKDLAVMLRRGESLHDKYWAGSSDTDDLMAELFTHASTHRLEEWEGIHAELTTYVKEQGLTPVGLQCTLSDFFEFGEYGQEERCEMAGRFLHLLAESGTAGREGLMMETLAKARALVCEGRPISLNPASPSALQAQITSPPAGALDPWQLLPVLSLVAACDPDTALETRARLAYHVLLDDALNWKAWFRFRSLHLFNLLPDLGAKLVPLLKAPIAPPPDGDILRGLWAERLQLSSEEDIATAREDLASYILSAHPVQETLQNFLIAQGRGQELLSYAQMAVAQFPGQRNAEVFLAMVTRLANG